MFRMIFFHITSYFSVSENIICNAIVLAIIGTIAYFFAYDKVGELGLRGNFASDVHWIIRLFCYVSLVCIYIVMVEIVRFIIKYLIAFLGCSILAILFGYACYIAYNNPDSWLNKKIL